MTSVLRVNGLFRWIGCILVSNPVLLHLPVCYQMSWTNSSMVTWDVFKLSTMWHGKRHIVDRHIVDFRHVFRHFSIVTVHLSFPSGHTSNRLCRCMWWRDPLFTGQFVMEICASHSWPTINILIFSTGFDPLPLTTDWLHCLWVAAFLKRTTQGGGKRGWTCSWWKRCNASHQLTKRHIVDINYVDKTSTSSHWQWLGWILKPFSHSHNITGLQ